MHPDQITRATQALRRAEWLSGFDNSFVTALTASGRLTQLRKGEWTHAEGDRETGLIIVVEGALEMFTTVRGDRQVLVGHAEAGSAFGQTARFGGGPRIVSAIAVAPSLLLIISDVALSRLAPKWPDVWRAVAGLAHAQLRANVRSLAEVVALPPSPRLAARLINLATPKRAVAPVTISISQQALGELIGLTRKTVNRVLADFEHKGLVKIGYGQLELLDLSGLERAANA